MGIGCAWVLAGTYVFFSQWTVWKGLAVITAVLLATGLPWTMWQVWSSSAFARGALLWVFWMLGSSLLTAGTAGAQPWLWGATGLLLWQVMLHQTGRDARRTRWLGLAVVTAATVSALVSIVEAVWFDPGWHWGLRLGNRMVYGGWNQVCSGVTFAFAAVWALCLELEGKQGRREGAAAESKLGRWLLVLAHVVLVFTALASLSRGALLVLLAGHGVGLLLAWRSTWFALLRFLLVAVLFHLLLPGLAEPNAQSPPETEVSRRFPRRIDSNPWREWTKRGSTGRLAMYQAVAQTLQEGGAGRLAFGAGLWSPPALWNEKLPERERAPHPHSVLVATALHGGAAGLIGLLVVGALGLATAWRAARQAGWPVGLILVAAGAAGVVFDGQSLASLDTLPRFEPLLLWTGLFLASGRASGRIKSSLDSPRSNE